MQEKVLKNLHEQFWFYLYRRRFKEALQTASEYIAVDPASDTGYIILSVAHYSLGDYEPALEQVNTALGKQPLSVYSLKLKGQILYYMRRNSDAVEVLKDALLLAANDEEIYALLAENELLLDNLGKAREFAFRSLEIAPNEEAFRALARIDLFQENYDQANEWINEALKINPENSYSNSLKGEILLKLRHYTESQNAYLNALRLSPGNSNYKKGFLNAIRATFPLYKMYAYLLDQLSSSLIRRILLLLIPFEVAILFGVMLDSPQVLLGLIIFIFFFGIAAVTIITPVTNALLLFHPVGKHSLTSFQIKSGVWLTIHFFLIFLFLTLLVIFQYERFVLLLLYLYGALFPIAAALKEEKMSWYSYFNFGIVIIGFLGVNSYPSFEGFLVVFFIWAVFLMLRTFLLFIRGIEA